MYLRAFVTLVVCAAYAVAQPVMPVNGTVNFTGTLNGSSATATAPIKVGSSAPGTCTVGDLFFNTSLAAGSNIQICAATNVWSSAAAGGVTSVRCFVPSGAAATQTGVTALTSMFTVQLPTLVAGDLVKLFMIFQHGLGVDTGVNSIPNIQVKFAGTNVGANTGLGAATDLGYSAEYLIAITGTNSQITVARFLRDIGSHQASAWVAAGTTLSNTTPILDVLGRTGNGANDDVFTAAFACVEIIGSK